MVERAVAKRTLPIPPVDIRGDVGRLTERDIQIYVNPMANEVEATIFLRLCVAENVNPFKGEAYLIKYSKDAKAAFVLDYTVYVKRANRNPHFKSSEDGLIFRKPDNTPEYREGQFYFPEEDKQMVGGWCRIYRDDRTNPIFVAVSRIEVQQYTGSEGRLGKFWTSSPGWMCNKTAIRRCFKKAFPEENQDLDDMPTKGEYRVIQEGELPQAFLKEGKPDFEGFYAKQSSRNITHDQVHEILGVASLKDWCNGVRTLEQAHEVISKWIMQRNNVKDKSDLFGLDKEPLAKPGETPLAALKDGSQTASTSAGVSSGTPGAETEPKKFKDYVTLNEELVKHGLTMGDLHDEARKKNPTWAGFRSPEEAWAQAQKHPNWKA